jgi:hypothetical protein
MSGDATSLGSNGSAAVSATSFRGVQHGLVERYERQTWIWRPGTTRQVEA